MDVPDGYRAALLLTLAIEVPVYTAGLRVGVRGFAAGVVGNLLSHPLIFIVLPVPAFVGEPIAWTLEVIVAALFVRGRRRFEDVLTVVLAANVLSMLVGALL
jgi:hypothetical protein